MNQIVVHCRDKELVGMAHKIKSPALIFPDDDGAVQTESKQAFRSTQNASNKLLQIFKKTEFYTD